MLVELQLTHCQSIRDTINKAWNIGVNTHKKKEKEAPAPAENSGPSQHSLATVPIATDASRLRYWHFDGELLGRCIRHMSDELYCYSGLHQTAVLCISSGDFRTCDSRLATVVCIRKPLENRL